jgi:hypothetical protein
MGPTTTETTPYESLGQMGQLMATQIAHLKFAADIFSAGLLAGLLARFLNPGEASQVGFQPRGRPAFFNLSRPGLATTLRQIALVRILAPQIR